MVITVNDLFICIDIIMLGSDRSPPVVDGVQLTRAQCLEVVSRYYNVKSRVQPPRNGRKPQRPLDGFFVSDY